MKKLTKIIFTTLFLLQECHKREPIIEITNPQNNSIVSGIVNITAEVIDGEDVLSIGFFIDDSLEYFCTTEPYSYLWNTLELPDSSLHKIYAEASFSDGKYACSETISVIVYNTLLFFDDFEWYYPSQYPSKYWFIIWAGVDAYVDTNFSYQGENGFCLLGSNEWVRTDGVELELKDLTHLSYECAILVPLESTTGALVGFFYKISPTLGTMYNGVLFDYEDSLVQVRGMDPQSTNYKWQRGIWYKVRVSLDYENRLMDVWINEKMVADDVTSAPKEISETFALSTEYGAGGSVYFDDVKVYKK
uniref:Uncharacterized protein n=1 Tax=candidate division WOR-3 bacterium TaxID=2052148 RepID=A0A7C4X9S6_UNCW3